MVVVVAGVVVGGDVGVLGEDVGQPAAGRPAAPTARGGGGGGGRGGGGGGGGGGAVDGPVYPALHADAPLPAEAGSPSSSSVLFLAVSSLLFTAVAMALALRAGGGVWGGKD